MPRGLRRLHGVVLPRVGVAVALHGAGARAVGALEGVGAVLERRVVAELEVLDANPADDLAARRRQLVQELARDHRILRGAFSRADMAVVRGPLCTKQKQVKTKTS
eukprot:CAMPEP_0174891232 /NCGR_PEP_ID=MMETSP0167-20121228/6305_1 /TAXON_ID=38298 /ORGANISM="Rhodella maculata, Strain CCMP736" /LENGTH=105 /DNA_ID=CAMNT_0016129311 /DNA_START=708 /DNA_END=1021 /DNA_ORIENTATION=-